ncbi:MAG: hypothetical protein MSS46_08700, partial [Oscillospiraceae bacterium]|nr:hypothetical protein [Oscillospiraceae bacterium]
YAENNINKDFNPRPPWGGRPTITIDIITIAIISIHALRGEGDIIKIFKVGTFPNFNPRPPWGGRLKKVVLPLPGKPISIHALRGEGDCKNIQICNIVFVHSAYKTIYFCDSCAFYLT